MHVPQQVNKLEVLPDKQFLAAAGNPQVRLFEINSNNPNPVRLCVRLCARLVSFRLRPRRRSKFWFDVLCMCVSYVFVRVSGRALSGGLAPTTNDAFKGDEF